MLAQQAVPDLEALIRRHGQTAVQALVDEIAVILIAVFEPYDHILHFIAPPFYDTYYTPFAGKKKELDCEI